MTVQTVGGTMLGQGAWRQPFVHDNWAGLSHVIGTGVASDTFEVPGVGNWVPALDRRRLTAYQALQAMLDNVRRHWLPRHMWLPGDPDPKNPEVAFPPALQYREYGNPRTVMEAARSLVLGVEQRFHVPSADPIPEQGGAGRMEALTSDSLPRKVQEYLDGWWDDEDVTTKLVKAETDACGLGDAVIALVWDDVVKRPRMRVYNPGFYFPDWSKIHDAEYVKQGWRDEDYPPVVHFAWEWDDADGNVWIHRSTFRMEPLKKPRARPYGGVATWTCMWEQADYDPSKLGGMDVYAFPKGAGRNRVGPIDLNIDFIPVVHVPCDSITEWGRSILVNVAQILDDMNSADTDLALNSQVVASPKLITKNAQKEPQAGPGDWINLFGEGDATLLDTSKTLDALLKHGERLATLVARNSRLGQVLLGYSNGAGHNAASSGASGYAIRLGFVTAEALEREMTMVRRRKYALLAKMVTRFAQANELVPTGDTPKIRAVLGKGLPADRAATIAEVTALLEQKGISTLTAVQLLIEAGVPIDDAHEEVKRIQAENWPVGVGIVEATGNVKAASDYMSVEYVEPPPPQDPNADPNAGPASGADAASGQPTGGGPFGGQGTPSDSSRPAELPTPPPNRPGSGGPLTSPGAPGTGQPKAPRN